MRLLNNKLTDEIIFDIETIDSNGSVWQEKNFHLRANAIDDIEYQIIVRIDSLLENKEATPRLHELKADAENLRRGLEDLNASLFRKLRLEISDGSCKGNGLMELMKEYLGARIPEYDPNNAVGYDELDLLVNGILTHHNLPEETREREPEMVFYQKTPVRVILELIKRAEFTPQDFFYDLGSGLGQAVMLVNLLSGVLSKGVEFEPAFCKYAGTIAAELQLSDVEFINSDARQADYSAGTVFFMYTPFEGILLQEVLEILKAESEKRVIKLFTYGPCTFAVAQQSWLNNRSESQFGAGAFGDFISV